MPYITETIKDINSKEIEKKINDTNYITLTLRDYGFAPERNTTQIDITIALKLAKKLKIKLVIIPDDINKISDYQIDEEIIIYKKQEIK